MASRVESDVIVSVIEQVEVLNFSPGHKGGAVGIGIGVAPRGAPAAEVPADNRQGACGW